MSYNASDREYIIDERDASAIQEQMRALASSYTPEWGLDLENPDIGAVIALIYARQMAETIGRLNLAISKYRTEFVNMLGLPLRPAHPARGVVLMRLAGETISGVDLPRGTKLLGGSAEDPLSVIFETTEDVHITNSRLRDIMEISPSKGRILPIVGGARRVNPFGEMPPAEAEPEQEFPIFTLFDFDAEGIQRNALLLYHKNMFDVESGLSLSIRMTDAATGMELGEQLCDTSRYLWSYLSEDGFKPFDSVRSENGVVTLERDGPQTKTEFMGQQYSAIQLETTQPVHAPLELKSIGLSSSCDAAAPDFIAHNATEMFSGSFMPFGEAASLFDECYIGQDVLFGQQGAIISLSFNLSYKEKLITYIPQQGDESLRVIKRKPRVVLFDTAHTVVQRVNIEYFNGLGWRALPCDTDVSTLFNGAAAGDITLRFICPEDWQPLTIGGNTGRCLRMRVEQADNCYLQPCMHRMPEITGLTMRYHYPDTWKLPHRVRRISGAVISDLTSDMLEGKPFAAFAPLPYTRDALYLGFDKKMNNAPASLFFNIEPCNRTGGSVAFEYSTLSGFKTLKVIDHTESLSSLGSIIFIPPPDFAQIDIEGVSRFWIRVSDPDGVYENGCPRPVIKDIAVNAAEILNVETKPEESFYIEASRPNMSFPLGAQNILTADVFVNERGMHSAHEMRHMTEQRPEDVRLATNYLGEITEFFVRWSEVSDFDSSKPGDRHYRIDRMRNTLHFGDGLNVMIPRAQSGEAITVTARCTKGAAGNLPAGSVDVSLGRLLHIDSISNPVDTWGGSDIESVEMAHSRGANTLSSLGRLISASDFLRETKDFSASIVKARVVIGRDIDGRWSEGLVTVAVMTKDYENGAYSFTELKNGLKRMLLQKSEMTLRESQLVVTEPVYVTLSVTVFVETSEPKSAFEIQNSIKEAVYNFIDPLSDKEGWDIGVLPDMEQLRLLLGAVRCPGVILGFTASAQYSDKFGSHERGLDEIERSPGENTFMIAVNGTHSVHVSQP